jgi:hypothetical protein
MSLEIPANTRVFRMNIESVRHEAGRQRDDFRVDRSARQRAIRLDVVSRVYVIAVPANVMADISKPARKVPIEVDESDFEALRQESTDRALAGSTRADKSNLVWAVHETANDIPPQ